MDIKKAVSIISRYCPCGHDNYERLTFELAKCENCGETFNSINYERYQKAVKDFEVALDCIQQLVPVDPTPQYGDVPVKRWIWKPSSGLRPNNALEFTNEEPTACIKHLYAEVVIDTERKPLPRKVVKEWRFKGSIDNYKGIDWMPDYTQRPDWIAGTSGEFIYRAEVEE